MSRWRKEVVSAWDLDFGPFPWGPISLRHYEPKEAYSKPGHRIKLFCWTHTAPEISKLNTKLAFHGAMQEDWFSRWSSSARGRSLQANAAIVCSNRPRLHHSLSFMIRHSKLSCHSTVNKDVPLSPCRLQGGDEIQPLLILDLGTRWGWAVSVTPRSHFTPGNGPPVPIGQEAGWPSELVWTQRLE
jgi:hypothetical protein